MAEFDDKLNQILSNPDAMAQIARLAQSLNASAPPGTMPPPAPDNVSSPPPPAETTPDPAPDAETVAKFLPLLQELGGDSNARQLLYALRPYLQPRKQEKIERALRLARLFRVGKRFLSQWEG